MAGTFVRSAIFRIVLFPVLPCSARSNFFRSAAVSCEGGLSLSPMRVSFQVHDTIVRRCCVRCKHPLSGGWPGRGCVSTTAKLGSHVRPRLGITPRVATFRDRNSPRIVPQLLKSFRRVPHENFTIKIRAESSFGSHSHAGRPPASGTVVPDGLIHTAFLSRSLPVLSSTFATARPSARVRRMSAMRMSAPAPRRSCSAA